MDATRAYEVSDSNDCKQQRDTADFCFKVSSVQTPADVPVVVAKIMNLCGLWLLVERAPLWTTTISTLKLSDDREQTSPFDH